ncbi:hypothetical protein COLO4_34886 [Corchorus olitorius]|uniref:Btz domain-containing protein n=1 Tax=Corchorus olitorius TaxID=93759 RepID=A0A1R3GJ15_9ROSI|nr:hypothetical protein COLO4_34886 [Corchorus olitorius]
MANSGEVEAEYESEPEMSLLQRRREASDDDNDVEEEESNTSVRLNRSVWRIGYDDGSDGCEGAAEYYDDEEEDDEVSYIDELEMLGEQVEEESKEEVAEQVTATKQRGNEEKVNDADKEALKAPRIGAFYMHDDRFGGLRRRSRNQRRQKDIWEPKDKLRWMHDKFEEMTLERTHTEELNAFGVHRTSNWNKNNAKNDGYKAKTSRPHSTYGNNGNSQRIVKGRGPIRYRPLSRSISANSPMERMQSAKTEGTSCKTYAARVLSANNKRPYEKSQGKSPNTDSQKASSTKVTQLPESFGMTRDADSSTVFSTKSEQYGDLGMASYTSGYVPFHGLSAGSESDSLPFDQHLLAPNMSYYPQAFYPASSFHYDNFGTRRSMVLPGSGNVVPQNELFPVNIPLDIPYAQERVGLVAENHFTRSPFHYSLPGSMHMASFESRDQRIGSSISPPSTHQAFPNQLNRVSSLAQHSLQQIPVDNAILPPSHVLAPQFHSCLGSRSQKLFEASALSFYGRRTLESLAGTIQSNIASLGTGSNIISPPQYTGIQGDQNFSTSSALFPGI